MADSFTKAQPLFEESLELQENTTGSLTYLYRLKNLFWVTECPNFKIDVIKWLLNLVLLKFWSEIILVVLNESNP